MSEDLITNRQRAVAAFETIGSYTATKNELGGLIFRGAITGDQRQDQDRLIRLLAALRHHSDCVNGLRFDDATRTARWQYDRERARLRGFINPYQVAAARRAIHVKEKENRTPALYGAGFWPPDSLRDLRRYADRKRVSFEAAMGSLTAGLITDLLQAGPLPLRPPITYGQMPPVPGLDAYYRRNGFEALDEGAGPDLWLVLGVHPHTAGTPAGAPIPHRTGHDDSGDRASHRYIRPASKIYGTRPREVPLRSPSGWFNRGYAVGADRGNPPPRQ